MKILPTDFDGQPIRRVFDEDTETWWFSVVDVVQVLTESKSAKRYWSDLKRKLAQEAGSEQPYEEIVQFKLTATDGKQRETDCAKAATLLRIVQSIPSPKAEPIKVWLAKVGYERMQEMADPALSLNRARQTWQQHGRSDKWTDCRNHGRNGHGGQHHGGQGGGWHRQTSAQAVGDSNRQAGGVGPELPGAARGTAVKSGEEEVRPASASAPRPPGLPATGCGPAGSAG